MVLLSSVASSIWCNRRHDEFEILRWCNRYWLFVHGDVFCPSSSVVHVSSIINNIHVSDLKKASWINVPVLSKRTKVTAPSRNVPTAKETMTHCSNLVVAHAAEPRHRHAMHLVVGGNWGRGREGTRRARLRRLRPSGPRRVRRSGSAVRPTREELETLEKVVEIARRVSAVVPTV